MSDAFLSRAERHSHLTAIKRKRISAPLRWLLQHKLVKGSVLDFGCGRGDDALSFVFDRYDPHYFPCLPTRKYDTVLCHYVINTLPRNREEAILKGLQSRLKRNGVAYITVRREVKVEGYTARGTYQRMVRLNLPILHETPAFCIYRMVKDDRLG